MSLGETHLMWRDSVPVTSFPFRYRDRVHGVIAQTWGDVKEKLGRDAQSAALPFSSAHIAPSQLHTHIIREANEREQKSLNKLESMIAESSRRAGSRPQTAPSRRREPQTTSEVMSQFARKKLVQQRSPRTVAPPQEAASDGAAAAADAPAAEATGAAAAADEPQTALRATPDPHVPVHERRQRPISAIERRVLTEGDDSGSRGRAAYLRLRRRLPVQHRNTIRQTSAQQYGWEQLDFTPKAVSSATQQDAVLEAVGRRVGAAPPIPQYHKATTGPRAPQTSPPASGGAQGSGADSATAAASKSTETPLRTTAIGTVERVYETGSVRRPGESAYYGRRSYLKQLSRRTGVFARPEL